MLKKGILIAVALIVLFSGIALAQEEQQSCESQSLPEGFTCIEGAKGQTIFSEEQLNSVLGENSFEIKENDGVILLKYKIPGSRATKDLGYLSGRIIQYKDPSVLTVSSFIASDYSKLNVSISNGFNLKPNAPNDFSSIEFSSLVGNIRYMEHNYTFLCKTVSGEGRQTSSARCIMDVVIKASQDASCFSSGQQKKCFASSLNVVNFVVAVHNSKLQDYINGEEVSEEYITPLENLENIELLNSSEMDLAGRTGSMTNAQFRGFDSLIISAVTGGNGISLFGKMQVDTEGQPARLEHQTFYSGTQNEQGRYLLDSSYYIITAKKASADYTSGANIAMFANNLEEGAEGIKIKVDADNLMQLRRGALILTSNSLAYEGCHSTVSPNLQVDYRPFLNSRFFRDKGCAYISGGVINIKPRSYQNAVDGNTYPFTLDVILPQGSAYTDLNLEPFETYGQIASYVTLQKAGLLNKVIFYADDINMPVEGIRSIFDFGVSFSAYVYQGTGFREGEVPVYDLAYEHIWCNLQERACWIQPKGGARTQWLGESPARTAVRCSADADCGNMDVSKCIEGHCVRSSDCRQVPDVNPSTVTNRKLDILFINDFYKSSGEQTDEDGFTDYLKEYMLCSGNSRVGLLTAAPFDDNTGKIASWYIQSEVMPVNPYNNGFEAAQFVNEIRKRCPQSDQVIVVSGQDFTPHTQGMRTGVIYFSMPSATSLIRDINKVGRVLMHEFGHGFAGLADEYTGGGTSTFIDSPNCVPDEATAHSEWGRLASSALRENNGHPWTGCGGACANINGACINYLKPSVNSLMHDADHLRMSDGAAYNPVSQRIISDLLGEYS